MRKSVKDLLARADAQIVRNKRQLQDNNEFFRETERMLAVDDYYYSTLDLLPSIRLLIRNYEYNRLFSRN